MGQIHDFRTGAVLPESLSANPDQVVVTYRGDTRTFDSYGDLCACVLVDCRDQLDAERDAAIARAIVADRRARRAADLKVIGRLAMLAALLGSAAAVLAWSFGA